MNGTAPAGCLIQVPHDGATLAWETLAISTALVLGTGYQLYFAAEVRRRPLQTVRGTMQRVRRSWVAAHQGKGMLPVNTLRDVIKSAQWFASSALLVAVGACGFLASSETVLNSVLRAKIACFIAACGLTFIFFMHSTRYYTHVSFMINCHEVDGVLMTEEAVYRMVARAADMWGHGMRCQIFVALPALFWIFGPAYLVVAQLLIVVVMAQLDFEMTSFVTSLRGEPLRGSSEQTSTASQMGNVVVESV